MKQNPATKVQSKVRGTLISQLRGYDGSGVFAATQLRTTQMSGRAGCVGYFGVQWIGRASENDLLLFSMWDSNNTSNSICLALPKHSNCRRNLNDGKSWGTQCKYKLPEKLKEQQEITLQIERGAVARQINNHIKYYGHVWTVKFRNANDTNQMNSRSQWFGTKEDNDLILGRILLTDKELTIDKRSQNGIHNVMMFHEPFGCIPCGRLMFEDERIVPTIIEAIDSKNIPQIKNGKGLMSCPWNNFNCTCHSFNVEYCDFRKVIFRSGPNFTSGWNDLKKANEIFSSNTGNTTHIIFSFFDLLMFIQIVYLMNNTRTFT